jgi:hypothetical protein
MPIIKETEINWTEIKRLKEERDERNRDPSWDHLEEGRLPMGGWEHLTLLPFEKMSEMERDQVRNLRATGEMKAEDVVRIS